MPASSPWTGGGSCRVPRGDSRRSPSFRLGSLLTPCGCSSLWVEVPSSAYLSGRDGQTLDGTGSPRRLPQRAKIPGDPLGAAFGVPVARIEETVERELMAEVSLPEDETCGLLASSLGSKQATR